MACCRGYVADQSSNEIIPSPQVKTVSNLRLILQTLEYLRAWMADYKVLSTNEITWLHVAMTSKSH